MREMVIYGVSFDMVGKQPIVLLKTADGNRFLPIWIGHPEAAAILVKLQNAAQSRPMTHDLLNDVLGHLDAEVISIAVTEMRENTYYARITLQQNGSEIEVDSRPSDAIALAVRAGAKIYVADDVIEESGVEFEGDASDDEIAAAAGAPPLADLDPDEFRAFLDSVTPDDFVVRPGRELAAGLRAPDLALGQVEQLGVDLLQAFGRERAPVRARQVLQHPLLSRRVEEADTALLLHLLEPRDELQPGVERLDDADVVVGELLAQLPDQRVVGVVAAHLRGVPRPWCRSHSCRKATARSTSECERSRATPGTRARRDSRGSRSRP